VTAPTNSPVRLPCGSIRLRVNGEAVTLRPSGALWLEQHQTLVVADLHLEKGSAYAARGQMLPPYDTADTLRRLNQEVTALEPRRLILLGDSLHDGQAEARLAPTDVDQIDRLAQGLELLWVIGNHDADGARDLPGQTMDEIHINQLILRHEPLPAPQPGEVAGHLHPCAKVVGKGRSVRRRCFATDGQRLILPAFGAYAGGLNLRDEAFSPLFVKPPIAAALGKDQVHLIGWQQLVADR
jgi:DNA ligase-associated metallophosphoesterase